MSGRNARREPVSVKVFVRGENWVDVVWETTKWCSGFMQLISSALREDMTLIFRPFSLFLIAGTGLTYILWIPSNPILNKYVKKYCCSCSKCACCSLESVFCKLVAWLRQRQALAWHVSECYFCFIHRSEAVHRYGTCSDLPGTFVLPLPLKTIIVCAITFGVF